MLWGWEWLGEGREVKGEGGERDRGNWRKQVSLSKEPEILP